MDSLSSSTPLWLEYLKLLAGIATPLVAAWFGYYISKAVKRLEASALMNQKIIERRLKVFDDMSPLLNDLYCYFRRIGHWRELSPPALISAKRTLDKTFYINRALFSVEFEAKYFSFIMDDCFKPYVGEHKNAQLRMDPKVHKEDEAHQWDPAWDALFVQTSDDVCSLKKIEMDYETLMQQFAIELAISRPRPVLDRR